jgi:N6-adenosine-specific RNA methylase IME4
MTAYSTYFIGLPLAHFGAGIADPGWYFTTFSQKGRGKARQYTCQSLEEITRLPVGELFRRDAALAVWCTQYAAAKGWPQDALRAWGFEPQTQGAWGKRTKSGEKWFFGLGKILRSCVEFYIIGTRDHPPVRSKSVRNFIEAPWRGESVKPDQLHRDIEQLYDGPYVELFARYRMDGWVGWGDQYES